MSLVAQRSPSIRQYTAAGGYPSFARVWEVPEPKARIVCLHGIISHGGWYLESSAALAEAGYEVHYLERRGSGMNSTARGDVDRFETWIEDVRIYLSSLGDDLPRLLLGVSWGGKLALAVAKHSPTLISGFGMLCPGLYAPRGPSALQKKLLAIASTTKLREQKVTIPLQDPLLFTDNSRWQAYIDRDPLTLRQVTLRFAFSDVKLDKYLEDAAAVVTTPALLMLAGRDRISDNPRLRSFFEALHSESKTLIEYPHAAHTLEFEPEPQKYFEDLVAWADSQTASVSAGLRTRLPR